MELTMPKTDLHKELIKLKSKSNLNINLDFDPNKIESNRLFHIDDIKKICIDYRLRFLDFDSLVWIPWFGFLGLDSWAWIPWFGFLGFDS